MVRMDLIRVMQLNHELLSQEREMKKCISIRLIEKRKLIIYEIIDKEKEKKEKEKKERSFF